MSRTTGQLFLATVVVVFLAVLVAWWYFGFSLDFMRFFASEPGVTDTTNKTCTAPAGCTCQVVVCVQAPCDPIIICPTTSQPPGGSMVQCAPATQTVSVGVQAALTASGGLLRSYEWFSPDGTPTSSGASAGTVDRDRASSYRVAYSVPGIKKVTVQGSRRAGAPEVDSVACTVIVTSMTNN